MALSDACFDFLSEMEDAESDAQRREAVRDLQRVITFYSEPPFRYGDELQTLAAACTEFLRGLSTANADPLQRITFLAEAIRDHLDTPPGAKVTAS